MFVKNSKMLNAFAATMVFVLITGIMQVHANYDGQDRRLIYIYSDFENYVGTQSGATAVIPEHTGSFAGWGSITGQIPNENYYIGEIPPGGTTKALKFVSEVVREGTSFQSLSVTTRTTGSTNVMARAAVFETKIMFGDTRMARRLVVGGTGIVDFSEHGVIRYNGQNIGRYKADKWYHIIIALDSNVTDASIVSLYINGVGYGSYVTSSASWSTNTSRIEQTFTKGDVTDGPAVMWVDCVKIFRQDTRFAYTANSEISAGVDSVIELPFNDFVNADSLSSITMKDSGNQPVEITAGLKKLGYGSYAPNIITIKPNVVLDAQSEYIIDFSGVKSMALGQYGALNSSFTFTNIKVSTGVALAEGIYTAEPDVLAFESQVKASCDVINNTNDAITPTLVLAIYKNNMLEGVSFEEAPISVGERKKITSIADYSVANNINANEIDNVTFKVMLWNETMTPFVFPYSNLLIN